MTDLDIRSCYTPAMLADLVQVNVALVRAWQRRGWIVPECEEHRLAYFPFSELSVARQLAELHRAGIAPASLERKLAEIQRRLPQIGRPLAELSIVADGKQILVRQAAGLAEPSGQLRIDFAALENEAADAGRPATIVSPAVFLARGRGAGPADAPQQLVAWAAELEEAGDLASAAEMYRAALAAGGPQAGLCFQLAELLYRQGDCAAARERYYMAIELDEDYVEARANLGCLLAELGQRDLAIAALEGALAYHEPYADAHYHLARTLDEAQRPSDALGHWQRFIELAPDSPWVQEAQRRLGE
jgi:tetratricopeptide (TPR) repeat protein